MNKLRDVPIRMVQMHRWPLTERFAWTMTAVWAFVLSLPVVSILLSPNWRGLDLTSWVGWSNSICIILNTVMLVTSIRGLLWIRAMKKSDTLAG